MKQTNQRNKQQQDFFDETKNQYDVTLIHNPPYHTVLETEALLKGLPKPDKKKIVVDFGAGSGRITIPLLQKGYTVTSVDLSDKSLRQVEDIAKKMKLSKLQTSTTIPRNAPIQAIVGADILHHVILDDILPVMYKALEKDGVVSFSEPCAWNPTWHVYLRIASEWEVEKRMIYCSYFNLKRTFERHGFKDVRLEGLGVLPRPFFNWSPAVNRLHDASGNLPLIKLFAYRYIITAKK